ncbi:hypothetical protein [Deinococcus aquatilis]|uniref:hypothetical protein n=1 Tax=Deinococcus aquatilis TaxID=519440 RepID=UPI0003A793A2|nr:hypothetical protein [Deinococcus aquatilis]
MAQHVSLHTTARASLPSANLSRTIDRRPGAPAARVAQPSVDPSARPTPAVAALAVPLAHRLPTGFRVTPVSPSLQDETCDLILTLTRQGILPRVQPQADDTPAGYLCRGYAAAHQTVFDLANVEVELSMSRHWISLVGAQPVLEVRVLPPQAWPTDRIIDLRGLRADLARSDPHLFGALVGGLRTALAPYAPIFTAEDALLGETQFLFGESWEEMTEEALSEAHQGLLLNVGPRDLVRWADRQGIPHPYALGPKYPRPLWTAPKAVRDRLLDTLCGHVHPGLRQAGEVLRFVGTLPEHWGCAREWAGQGLHPGLIHVVTCQADPVRDPVLEVFRDLADLVGTPDEVETEPLQVFGVHDQASHQDVLAYVQAVGRIQEQVAEMWASLSG